MKALVDGFISFLKDDSSNPWLVLLWMNIGEAFLYKHNSGEKLFSMLISFIEDFLELLICASRPHLELRTSVFTDSLDK